MRMWHRLALANGLSIIATLMVFGAILTFSTVETLQRELDRRAQAGAQLVARQVEGVIRGVEYAGSTLVVMANDAVAEAVSRGTISLQQRIALENQLSFLLGVFPSVAHAWLVFPDGPVIGYGRLSASEVEVARLAQVFLPEDEPMGPNRLSGRREDQVGASILVLAKRLIDIATGDPLVALILAADSASFSSVVRETDADFAARFRIVDQGGVLVGEPSGPDGEGNYSEFRASLRDVNWHVISRVPRQAVETHTVRVVLASAVLLAAVSVVAIALALLLGRTVTRPLESLELQMRHMDVERGIGRLSAPGTWEIQRVADGANRLLERVHALVERVASEERERQRYHLELLQAQIKPHFLYNSLEMVHMLGETGRWRRAQRALRALSEFYRLSLAAGRELVPISTELELTEHYLFVQHLRYLSQFTYSVTSQRDHLEMVEVPKLTIQPLVENAIYHGVKGMDRSCHISVHVDTSPQDAGGSGNTGWRIIVSDNGRGMDPERLEELRNLRIEGSFGFGSVIQRLRLHLDRPIQFAVDSAPDKGTTVEISAAGSADGR